MPSASPACGVQSIAVKATSGPAGATISSTAASSSSISIAGMKPAMSSSARCRAASRLCRLLSVLDSFRHACHIRRLPCKMLAAVERDHLAGDRARLPEIADRRAEFAERPARASGSAPSTCALKSAGVWRELCQRRPGTDGVDADAGPVPAPSFASPSTAPTSTACRRNSAASASRRAGR